MILKINELLKNGSQKDNTIINSIKDEIQEIKGIKKKEVKIFNFKDKVQIFEPKISQKNEDNKTNKNIIINNTIQMSENKNIIKINDTKNDEVSDYIYENIKRKFALKDSEKVYVKMYEKFIQNLNVSSASLIKYKNNHI